MKTAVELNLDEEQIDLLLNYDVCADNLRLIPGKQLHEYMVRNNAYTDGYELIFFDDCNGGSMKDQNKFLYYMGAEKEAEIKAKHLGITIWSNIDEDRLDRGND